LPRRLLLLVLACLGLTIPVTRAVAQDATPEVPDTVKVFVDCMYARCDYEYIRTELPFVDHVRDREVADVHVLITGEGTAGGGTYTLHFIGRGTFAGVETTLHQTWRQGDSSDTLRAELVRSIRLGLVPFLTRTPLRDRLDVSVKARPGTEAPSTRARRDPWDYWIFRTQANTRVDGESSSNSASLSGSVSASRVTDAWKFSVGSSGSYRENEYDLDEGDTYRSVSRGYSVSGLAVKSVTHHWSAGVRASASSSTYLNQRLALRIAPAIEYDVLPYTESTRRKLTIQYAVGTDYFRYDKETIFGRLSEHRLDHALVVALDLRRPWGSMSTAAETGSYLDDFRKKRFEVSGEANVRLLKGLSLSVWGNAAIIRDQIYLPKGEATAEEILVRQRQLATSYRYTLSVGFSYTFGSIYTNVVNPRLMGSFGQPW
jgi:hypothetical protein